MRYKYLETSFCFMMEFLLLMVLWFFGLVLFKWTKRNYGKGGRK